MAGFMCRCGYGLSNQLAPNDVELTVYTDREWDDIIALGKIEDTIEIPHPKYSIWRCPKCERVYVFGSDNRVKKVYALETGWDKEGSWLLSQNKEL